MNIGDSFWLASSVGGPEHLWVVVAQQEERILIVNFSTLRHQPDQSCIFRAGEHPALPKDSVVRYDLAKEANPAAIEAAIRRGEITPHQRFSGVSLLRILTGALRSRDFRPRYKAWIQIPRESQ